MLLETGGNKGFKILSVYIIELCVPQQLPTCTINTSAVTSTGTYSTIVSVCL